VLRNIKAAAAIGLSGPLFTFVCHLTGVLRENWGGFLLLFMTTAVSLLSIGLAIRGRSRAIVAKGQLVGFGELVLNGLGICVLAAPIVAGGIYLFTRYGDPTYLEFYADEARRQIAAQDFPPHVYEQQILAVSEWSQPVMFAWQNALGTMIVGAFGSLVSGALFRGRS